MCQFMRKPFALPVITLWVATALRVLGLDAKALWWDEGLSLLFARMSYADNARMAVTLADTNPPFYRLLLGGWVWAVGSSAFSTRLFSALAGVLLVALVVALARALSLSNRAANIAAALCAASPMLIYYSQEAKAYSLVAMAMLGSAVLWLKLHRRAGKAWHWLAWGGALLLSVGSHYISAFFIAVQNAWSLAITKDDWQLNRPRFFGHWAWQAGAQSAVALALLPFVVLTFGGTSAAVRGETGDFTGLNGPAQFFGQHAVELTQGPTATGAFSLVVAAVLLLVALVGVVVLWQYAASPLAAGLLTSWILAPILLGFALNTYHEFFFPRFVLYTVPPLMLLVAVAIDHLSKRLPGLTGAGAAGWMLAILLLIVGMWSPTLAAHYNTTIDPNEDWRPVADAVRPLVRDGDAAIYVWGWIPGYLDAYLPPAPRPDYLLGFFTPDTLDSQMQALTAGKQRIWLLDYQVEHFDPRNAAGNWLGTRGALIHQQWIGSAHVALFALQPNPAPSTAAMTARFQNGLTLDTTRIDGEMNAGDALAITLEWTAVQPQGKRTTVFLHGLAADGTLAFSRDSEPRNGLRPFTALGAGHSLTEMRGVLLPPDLPAGTYTLQIGLYDTISGEVVSGSPVVLGTITVRR